MRLSIKMPVLILPAALITACGGSPEPPQQETTPRAPEATEPYAPGEFSHGNMESAGDVELGPLSVRAGIAILVEQGQDLPFDIHFTPAASAPLEVIGWIGLEDDPQTDKIDLDPMGPGYFHEHLDAPEPWNPEWKLWLEFDHMIEGETRISFPIPSRLE